MTWSTRYLIEKAASTKATSTPPIIAPTRPTKGFPVMLARRAALKAPKRNWPSIATLTTPTRSPMTPPSAPKMSGIDSDSAPKSRPVTGTSPPAAAHTRKPNIASTP